MKPVTSQQRGQRPGRSTIEDVAAAAGVSVATVSRALRGLPNVATSTRQRVQRVADRLDYAPDPAAARLAAGHTRTVTVVVPNLNGWYISNVVAGAEALCSDAGYDVLIVGIGSSADLSRLLSESYQLERRTDGLLAIEVPVAEREAESLAMRGISLATVGTATVGHPSVRTDNVEVGRIAARHLLELGHRRVAVIGVHGQPIHSDVAPSRRRGFVEELSESGVELDPAMSVTGDFGIDAGEEAMAALLDTGDPPTAVFAMSDEMAFGGVIEMKRRGIVPGADLSIMGVDDHEFSRVVDLTTISHAVAEHGIAAARLLLSEMKRNLSTRLGGGADRDAGVESSEPALPIALVRRATTCAAC